MEYYPLQHDEPSEGDELTVQCVGHKRAIK